MTDWFNKINKKTVLILAAAIILAVSAFAGGFYFLANNSKIKTVEYEYAISRNKPIILYFYTDWCGYCRRFTPEVNALAEKYKKDSFYVMVNGGVQENEELFRRFNVRGVPTLFFLNPPKNHALYVKYSSKKTKDYLIEEFDSFLKRT